jgi:hypothetical protein
MSTTPAPLNPPVPPIATKPAIPAPAVAAVAPTLVATVEKDITWIKVHGVLVLLTVVLIIGGILGGIDVVENLIERHDARVAAAQQAKEGVNTATTAALMAQLTQDRVANTARDAQQTALIQTLVQQMSQQRAQTAKQIQTDATLDIQHAAQRLAAQMKDETGDVGIKNDLVTMTLPLTRNVIASLDLLPQAQADVVNLQGQLSAQQILTSDAKVEVSDAQNIIAADKAELIDTIKKDNSACQVRVDTQASKDRKRGFWVSLFSFAGGLVVRGLI